MILLEIVELIDERTKTERIQSGAAAQRAVKDELRRRFGDQIRRIKLARVGSKLFDIQADIYNVHQKVEVKSMSSEKPYFAFFDTYATKDAHSPLLDELTQRVTNGKYQYFSQAVEQESDGGFPCDGEDKVASGIRAILGTPNTPATKPGTPKSGRVPKILKNITDPYTLDFVRAKLIADLAAKGITYLALLNSTTGKVDYYHIQGENYLDAPKMPLLKKIFFDTYGAPMQCAMRIVVRIVL
jgi:hypothetical protein